MVLKCFYNEQVDLIIPLAQSLTVQELIKLLRPKCGIDLQFLKKKERIFIF